MLSFLSFLFAISFWKEIVASAVGILLIVQGMILEGFATGIVLYGIFWLLQLGLSDKDGKD